MQRVFAIVTTSKQTTQKANKMTESQKIQNELNAFNAKRNEVKSGSTVHCNAPETKRTYKYKSSPAIKASDIGSL